MLRTRPAPPPAARRQLFLDEEPIPVAKPPKSARTLALLRAIAQLAVILAVMGSVSAFLLKFGGDTPERVDPLTASRLPGVPAEPTDRARSGPEQTRQPKKERVTPPAERREAAAQPKPTPSEPAAPAAPATPPAPSTSERASATLARLDRSRVEARARLARAKTATPQSAAANDLAAACGQAAGELEELDAEKYAGIVQALRAAETAYTVLAQAIADGDQRLYDIQRDAVIAAESDAARERSALR